MTDRTMFAATQRSGPVRLGTTAMPDWRVVAGGLVLCAAAILFGAEIHSLSKNNDWWRDEIYSLWASDPGLSFGDVLRHRILTDDNPPLYYVLLYAVRLFVPEPRAAILALNGLVICATAIAVGLIGHRQRVLGFALAGFAAFLVSAPVLRSAVEGRAYLMALMVTYVAAWLGALALDAPTPRPAWWYWLLLGVLAALLHFFAALFCGCLAAALLLSARIGRRRDLIPPALTLGIAASAACSLWFLLFGRARLGAAAWLELSVDRLNWAAGEVTLMVFGLWFPLVPAAALAAVFAASACVARTRPLAILVGTTVALFLVVPCALSLAQPIIAGRYWMIGAPIIVVFLVFVARSALSGWRVPANRRLHMAACAGVVGLLLAMDGTGFFAARHWVRYLPFWKGTARVAPLLSQCGRGSVHVNMGPLLFAVAAHAPATTFVDVSKPPPGWTDSPDSRCPVLGWAEQIKEGGDFLAAASDRQLADMLRITAPLADITVLRHGRGYVVLRAHG